MQNPHNLHLATWEGGPDAPVALLIHGLASSSHTWKKFGSDLHQDGYTVIAPDLFGHGKSPKQDSYSIKQWGQSIIDLGIKPDLIVGHSLGGLIAAYVQPELKASKLVLVDPVFFLPHHKPLLKGIQSTFTQVMKYSSLIKKNHKSKNLESRIQMKRDFLAFLRWDKNTAQALLPDPKTITRRILAQEERILIIRAAGSYIAPQFRLKPALNYAATKIITLKTGHNLHITKYSLFLQEITTFLKAELTHDRNLVPQTLTV